MRWTTMARGACALAVVCFLSYAGLLFDASAQIVGPSTTTTQPQAPSTTAPGASPSTTVAKGGNDDPGATKTGTIPPGYAEIIASVKRSKPNNTNALLAALQPLVDAGMTQDEVVRIGFGSFPVGGAAKFTDDWFNPRYTPVFHLHEGTDIFAAAGTPIRAPVAGVVRHARGGAGGVAAYVTTREGHYVYFAHMSEYSTVKPGDTVNIGDVIGYVGTSGNAVGGAPHLHIELHPKGKGPVNPKPYLDHWIATSLAAAPQIVASRLPSVPTPTTVPIEPDAALDKVAQLEPQHVPLAWASSANPTGGSLQLAEHEAVKASLRVDWAERARIKAERDRRARESDETARRILRPLTPPGLLDVLGLR
jgi:murein DD-endopeptidase MepM/ murein hydrolase activator NlpD